jgi:hypothetical protein
MKTEEEGQGRVVEGINRIMQIVCMCGDVTTKDLLCTMQYMPIKVFKKEASCSFPL